jgi:hypothetical protein
MAESSKKQVLSRRTLFGVAGGAAGLIIAKKVVSPAAPAASSPVAVGGVTQSVAPGNVAQVSAQAGQSAVAQPSQFAAPTIALSSPVEDKRLAPAAEAVPGPEADKRLYPDAPVVAPPVVVADGYRVSETVVPPEDVVRLPTQADDKRRAGSPNEAQGPVARTFVSASTPVLDLLAPLKPGAQVYDWTVVAIHDVSMGAVPVILADKSGSKFQVDILRRDTKKGAPRSVADAHGLSLFLANNGNGQKASDESKGLGVVALATVLSRRANKAPAGLLTWRERVALFPKGEYKLPV